MPDNAVYEIAGVIHIHSSYSDGSKAVEEIAAIGEKAGLDFLMFTDHMTLQPLRDGLERYYGKLAGIVGYEIEDSKNENHFLAFGLQKELPANLTAENYVPAVHDAGGLGIIAHPDEIRRAIPKYPSYPWTAWEAKGYDAIEIWNSMSAWMELLKRLNMLKMVFMPRRGLRGPTARILRKWDELSESGRVAGIGSADVHAHAYRRGPLKITIFPYKVQFRSIRTHLLLDEPLSSDIKIAKRQIFQAIRSCRVFVSNYRWGDARGFIFRARSGEAIYQVGDDIPFSDDLTLELIAPDEADIRLIHDGKPEIEATGDRIILPIREPGLYRAELLRKKRGWIYSNHLRVYKKG
jgi:hypothetical protein